MNYGKYPAHSSKPDSPRNHLFGHPSYINEGQTASCLPPLSPLSRKCLRRDSRYNGIGSFCRSFVTCHSPFVLGEKLAKTSSVRAAMMKSLWWSPPILWVHQVTVTAPHSVSTVG